MLMGHPAGEIKIQPLPMLFEVARVNDDVVAVAYLSPSGHTLTSVLDTKRGRVVSFASNEKELVVQHGRFAIARKAA